MAVYHGVIKYASVTEAVKALGPVAVTERDGKVHVRPLSQRSLAYVEARALAHKRRRPRHY